MALGNLNSTIMVALIGVAAILFIVAGLTGGGKWRRLYNEERDDHARRVNDSESELRDARYRVTELEREQVVLQQRLAAADKTIADLRASSAVAVAAPVVADAPAIPVTPVSPPVEPVAEEAHFEPVKDEAPAAEPASARHRDDLSRLRGVDGATSTRLSELGVSSYDDIVHLSAEDEMALETRLGIPVGLIARDQWRDQAALLRAGNESEFAERYGSVTA